jgi:NAD(P)-dependent dehydrogenase (short-subunit alcohol dehydrogenase family)
VPDRTIIITGASDGIGAAAARRLSQRGENVVVVGRSELKTKSVAADLGADWFVADYCDLAQVRALAQRLLADYPRIDVLANNAGGMSTTVEVTGDGHEKMFQVNYLAPFLLTTTLLDRLVESRAAVLNTSSWSHKFLRGVAVDDFDNTSDLGGSKGYAMTKLAVTVFTRELHRRYHHSGLSCVSYHPGSVESNFGPASGSRFLAFMRRTPVAYFTPPAERGADPLVWLASSTPGVDWTPGAYYSKLRLAKPNRLSGDPVLAAELWDRTLAKVSAAGVS